MKGQTDLLSEIIVDNFAGGGGASTGIELATGRMVELAINHDPDAILMHRTNHPHTEHLQASVWDIDPREVCRGRPVGLAWFSPDCKHFSKAKGGKPVEKKIRGLAWIVLRWAGTVSPRVIILENVEEFQTWGPVRKGKPIKSKQGQTFQKWKKQLSDLGYEIEHRELVAADYGAPTIRKRFVLVARLDGKPIAWPEPTHNRNGTDGKKPWRSAAEIIDWSLPCPSIFSSKGEIKEQYGLTAVRPLADNTMRRIIRGVDKFTIKSGKPFIVQCNHGGNDRLQDLQEPMPTVTGKHGYGVCSSSLIQYHGEQSENVRGQPLRDPLMVVDASNRYGLTAASLTEYYGGADHGQSLHAPQHTSTSHDRQALTLAHIAEFKGADIGQSATAPLRTITTSAGEFGAVKTLIVKYSEGTELQNWSKVRELLNLHCGYCLADNEVLLLNIAGILYYISDIGLRMLTPRELYNAMGFPPDYVIDHDFLGNDYSKTKQVARCGNAVCPPMATAIVAANLPEWCGVRYYTMSALLACVAG